MIVHVVVTTAIEEFADSRDVRLIDNANVVLRTLVHLSLVLLRLFVCHLRLLHVNLSLALNLIHLLFKLLLFLLQAFLFGQSCSASISSIILVLNFLLLFSKFGFKAHFFVFLSLAHG